MFCKRVNDIFLPISFYPSLESDHSFTGYEKTTQSAVHGAFVPSQKQSHILIPLTRRIKGYIRFVGSM